MSLEKLHSVYPYHESYTVRSFECDLMGNTRLAVLWRYMQEVATNHLVKLGIGYTKLYNEGIVFLLSDVSLKITRYPKRNEQVHIFTCPTITKGARMFREVLIVDEKGQRLCEFQTGWVLVNPQTHALLRPSAFKYPLPILSEYTPFCDIMAIKPKIGETYVGERVVRVSDIDRNRHLNNTIYLDIAADAIGESYLETEFSEVHIKYKGEAILGDSIKLYKTEEENKIMVSGHFEDRVCFTVEFLK